MKMIHKISSTLFLFVFFALWCGFTQAYPQSDKPKQPELEITLEPSQKIENTTLMVHVIVKNVSDHSLQFSSLTPFLDYDVRDLHGAIANQITHEASAIKQEGPRAGFIGSVPSWVIDPGQTVAYDEDLGERYQVKPLQRYRISLETQKVHGVPFLLKSSAIKMMAKPRE